MHRGLGRQVAGRGESVQAVAREFAGSDVVPYVAGLYTVGQQVLDHAVKSLLCLVDLAVTVQERRHIAVMVLPGHAGDEGERPQHRLQTRSGTVGPVPDCGQVVEVVGDLLLVPGEEDRLDVRKVLVQRRAPDPGVLRDPRHRHRRQPVLGHQCRGGPQDRLAYSGAVRVDRLAPELGHGPSIQSGGAATLWIDRDTVYR